MVIATENPMDFVGTYNLPEAQLDRFMMRLSVGYPSAENEINMLRSKENRETKLKPVLTTEELLEAQDMVSRVRVEDTVMDYIVRIVTATRNTESLTLGASPRASIALMEASKARAYMSGRDYVRPEDVKELIVPVLAHRLVVSLEASLKMNTAKGILLECTKNISMPPVFQ